jgi:hypothetical protein
MNTLLAAAAALSALAALAVVAWFATQPSVMARLVAAGAIALLAWLLLPVATETGLRDLGRWLGESERTRDLAAFATLDGMAGIALTVRSLLGTAGRREQMLQRWMPPLTTPLALFALCVLVTQSVDTLAFGTLRILVTVASLAVVLAVGALLAAAMPARAARLELRLVVALLMLLVAGWLGALASAPPGGTAPAVDIVALGSLVVGGLLVAAAGFVRERWRSRR